MLSVSTPHPSTHPHLVIQLGRHAPTLPYPTHSATFATSLGPHFFVLSLLVDTLPCTVVPSHVSYSESLSYKESMDTDRAVGSGAWGQKGSCGAKCDGVTVGPCRARGLWGGQPLRGHARGGGMVWFFWCTAYFPISCGMGITKQYRTGLSSLLMASTS